MNEKILLMHALCAMTSDSWPHFLGTLYYICRKTRATPWANDGSAGQLGSTVDQKGSIVESTMFGCLVPLLSFDVLLASRQHRLSNFGCLPPLPCKPWLKQLNPSSIADLVTLPWSSQRLQSAVHKRFSNDKTYSTGKVISCLNIPYLEFLFFYEIEIWEPMSQRVRVGPFQPIHLTENLDTPIDSVNQFNRTNQRMK